MKNGKKKDRKKKREPSEDDKVRDGKPGPWNTDDLYFDLNGRLVIKNPALADAIARVAWEQRGIVLAFGFPPPGTDPVRLPPKIPPAPPVPPWPNAGCPDELCGVELHLIARNKPLRDPPRDLSRERYSSSDLHFDPDL